MTPYERLTDIILELNKLVNQIEAIWHKLDPITCKEVYEQLPVQHLPCDSCEEDEDALRRQD